MFAPDMGCIGVSSYSEGRGEGIAIDDHCLGYFDDYH